jgi:hypothetical protein
VLGTGYAAAVVLLPHPTLAVSYQFVFGVLAVGALIAMTGAPWSGIRSREFWLAIVMTGIGAITLAWMAYLGVYLFLA